MLQRGCDPSLSRPEPGRGVSIQGRSCERERPSRFFMRVTRQRRVGEGLFELWGEAPTAACTLPGQFVHVRVGDGLLRRPFSVYRADGAAIALLYRVVGRGTRWLANVARGDALDVLGPLGTPFAPPAPGERLLLVGGGVGVAPLARFVEAFGSQGTRAVMGFRSAAQVVGLAPFGGAVEVVTEDGSAGRAGRVTDGIDLTGVDRVLTCGPDPMMRAVAAAARAAGVRCQVAVERPMGCGVGVCLACVVPVSGPAGDLVYARACHEGPVFDAEAVRW